LFAAILTCACLVTACGGIADSARDAIGTSADTVRDPRPEFPLRVAPAQRCLAGADGRPFLVHGDTPWSLAAQLTREQIERYLDDRRRKGFNAVLVNMLEHHFSDDPPRNAYGQPPFQTRGDFSTPNEAYFSHVEFIIAQAAERGILVMLTPAYLGYDGGEQGWYREMAANGAPVLRAYGRYLASRYRDFDNILWVHGGDYNPPDITLVNAVADGIREVEGKWLHTFHGSRGTSARAFLGTGAPWLSVNNVYTDESSVVAASLREYASSSMPFVLIEARYENAPDGHTSAADVRTYAYQAVLSGSAGQLMGNNPIWYLGQGWQQALDSPASRTLGRLRDLLESLDWCNLEPDADGSLLLQGAGTGEARAAAARSRDGAHALAYVPTVRTIVVDLAHLSGPRVRARWFDPVAGIYAPIPGSPFEAVGPRAFSPAGRNSAGDSDWVLVLDST